MVQHWVSGLSIVLKSWISKNQTTIIQLPTRTDLSIYLWLKELIYNHLCKIINGNKLKNKLICASHHQPNEWTEQTETKRNFYLIVLFNPQNHFVTEMERFCRGTKRSAQTSWEPLKLLTRTGRTNSICIYIYIYSVLFHVHTFHRTFFLLTLCATPHAKPLRMLNLASESFHISDQQTHKWMDMHTELSQCWY